MKVWITTFCVLFFLAQVYAWVKDFIVPLPLSILGGAFLAIASNYEKGIFPALMSRSDNSQENIVSQTATLLDRMGNIEAKSTNTSSLLCDENLAE
ncbi:MAG: hypothetical protein ACRC2R_27285 [Xenococcaceae cyanobacterium]